MTFYCRGCKGWPRALTIAAAVLCIAAASICAAVPVTVNPTQPLVGAPLLASPTQLPQGSTLYLSAVSICDQTNAITRICSIGGNDPSVNYDASTCVFTVTATALGMAAFSNNVPVAYWCSSVSGTEPMGQLQLAVVKPTPQYVFYGETAQLTFNAATPVGTKVGFYTTPACSTFVSGTTQPVLTSSRMVSLSVPSSGGNVFYVCASVPAVTGGTVTVQGVQMVKSQQYTVTPSSGLRYTTVPVTGTYGFSAFSLSTSQYCEPLAQQATVNSGGANQAALSVQAPMGTYYFCTMPVVGGAFVPADNQFQVKEYGIQPRAMYAGQQTQMTLTQSAAVPGVTFVAGLFLDKACTQSLISWTTDLSWTVQNVGTYYACVRDSSNPTTTTALAGSITVSQLPTVSFSRSPGIAGLGVTATVARGDTVGVVPISLVDPASGNGCSGTVVVQGETANTTNTIDLHLPAAAPPSVLVCIGTPMGTDAGSAEADVPYYYSSGTYGISAYLLSYPPLLVKTSLTIGLDPSVDFSSGAAMKLVPSSSNGCSAALGSNNNNQFSLSPTVKTLAPVLFPTSGQWLLCVSEPAMLGGQYVQLRSLQVYGAATITPAGVVPGIPAEVTVSAVPAGATVYVTADATCVAAGTNTQIVSATADSTGAAQLAVTYGKNGALQVCASYRGQAWQSLTDPVFSSVGTLTAAPPQVFPGVIVDGVESRLNVWVPDASLLVGGTAYLGSDDTACATGSVPTGVAAQGTIQAGESSGTMPYVLVTAQDVTAGSVMTLCVNSNAGGAFVSAGSVRVEAPMTMTLSAPYTPAEMPVRALLSGAAFAVLQSSSFVVLGSTGDCLKSFSGQTIYAQGSVDASGQTSVFAAPPLSAVTMRVCVDVRSNLVTGTAGYAEAGVADLYPFTSLSKYAVTGQPVDMQGWPMSAYATMYMTPCTGTGCLDSGLTGTCQTAQQKYYAPASGPLVADLAVGQYALCQQSTETGLPAVVGANTTVQVVPAWTLTSSTTVVRLYAPFNVLLSGGPIPGESFYNIRVQPASVACGGDLSGTTSQVFSVTSGATDSITVTTLQPEMTIRFCIEPSPFDSYSLMERPLTFYMTPATILAGEPTVVTSATVKSGGLAKLSSSSDCSGSVSGTAAPITAYQSTLTVTACGANANVQNVYYCESTDNGNTYAMRGEMGLLRTTPCGAGEAGASIAPVQTAPGRPITNFGIQSTFLTNPRLSTAASCDASALLPASVATTGYMPSAGEQAVFFVCAERAGSSGTSLFTTDAATLTVENYAVTPTSALSRNPGITTAAPTTKMTLNYATPSVNTFFSISAQCGTQLSTAPAMSAVTKSASYSSTNVDGLVYVCAENTMTAGALVAVAQFLSVTPPEVTKSSPAVIRNADYTATLSVSSPNSGGSPLYSMTPGADSGFQYASYYVTDARPVFLSNDNCASTAGGTTQVTADANSVVSIPVGNLGTVASSLQLCAGTPAGTGVAIANIPVAPGQVYPYQFVTGVQANIYIPSMPQTQFYVNPGNGNCDGALTSPLAPIVTDAGGNGVLTPYTVGAGGVITSATPGTYTLCYQATRAIGGALTPLATTISIVPQTHFAVTGTVFVVGVPGTMGLLYDLVSDYLLPGFATDMSCNTVSETVGSWTALSTKSIRVNAASAATGLYLCARAPVNGTVSALPGASGSLSFIASSIALPPGGTMNTCDSYLLRSCYRPGSDAPSDAVVGVVHGSCCSNLAGGRTILGQAMMNASTCEMELDGDLAMQLLPETVYSVCTWSPSDVGYCGTLGSVNVTADCTGASKSGSRTGLSGSQLAAIIVGCVVGGLLLIALIVWLLWCCCYYRGCCARGKGEDASAADDTSSSGYGELEGYPNTNGRLLAIDCGDTDSFDSRGPVSQHPLLYPGQVADSPTMYYAAPAAPSPSMAARHSTPIGIVEAMEEDGRNDIELEEASERYFAATQHQNIVRAQQIAEKNDDVEVSFESQMDPLPNDSRVDRGDAPTWRAVEEIDRDDTLPTEPGTEQQFGAKTLRRRPSALDGLEPEEEERRSVRNSSIASSAPGRPPVVSSVCYWPPTHGDQPGVEPLHAEEDCMGPAATHRAGAAPPLAARRLNTTDCVSSSLDASSVHSDDDDDDEEKEKERPVAAAAAAAAAPGDAPVNGVREATPPTGEKGGSDGRRPHWLVPEAAPPMPVVDDGLFSVDSDGSGYRMYSTTQLHLDAFAAVEDEEKAARRITAVNEEAGRMALMDDFWDGAPMPAIPSGSHDGTPIRAQPTAASTPTPLARTSSPVRRRPSSSSDTPAAARDFHAAPTPEGMPQPPENGVLSPVHPAAAATATPAASSTAPPTPSGPESPAERPVEDDLAHAMANAPMTLPPRPRKSGSDHTAAVTPLEDEEDDGEGAGGRLHSSYDSRDDGDDDGRDDNVGAEGPAKVVMAVRCQTKPKKIRMRGQKAGGPTPSTPLAPTRTANGRSPGTPLFYDVMDSSDAPSPDAHLDSAM